MTLKTRIIPTMLIRGRELVKGKQFVNERRVGNAISAAKIHNMRGVDELVMLEVGGDMIDPDVVDTLGSECFMPLAVGGGVHTLEQFGFLLRCGADKVVLGHFGLIERASQKFGAQAVVSSIAVRPGDDPIETAKYCQHLGAGEILLQSVERDGTMRGYDLPMIQEVALAVKIPVIASGGCAGYEDMACALNVGAHAVAAGALFQFTDATPHGAAEYLKGKGFNTRIAA